MAKKSKIKQRIYNSLNIRRAVKLVWKVTPRLTLINTVIVLIQSILPLAALYLMKQIVDSVTQGIKTADKGEAFAGVVTWIILAGVVAIVAALGNFLSSYISEAQSLKVTDHVSTLIHDRSTKMDLAFYENPKYYNTLQRALKEAPYRPTGIVKKLVEIAKSSFSLAGIGVLLFAFSWWIGFLLIFAAFPAALIKLKFSKQLFGFEERHTEDERFALYYHYIMTDSIPAKEVRLFNSRNFFMQKFENIRTILRTRKLRISRNWSLFEFSASILTTVIIFGIFAYICKSALAGVITLGSMVMYYQGFQKGLNFLKSILGSIAGLYEDNLFLTHFYRILDLKPEITAPKDPVKVADEGQLDIKNISFTYPGCSEKVLKDLTLKIPYGKVVAVVGENGCGKSTLVKLLCRFYDPDKGNINFNNTDLKMFDPRSWRSKISVIFQDYLRYNLTAEENIGMGDIGRREKGEGRKEEEAKSEIRNSKSLPCEIISPFKYKKNLTGRANPNDQNTNDQGENLSPVSIDIIKAAELSGADPVIRKLPKDYKTQLGRMYKEGEELSIGEWQKVALARTFYRDGNVIILDEPTSSLDPLAEAELFDHFKTLIRGKTAILISHRFSTVRMADKIFVMEDGKISEEGTHEELLKANKYYAKMYKAQAKNYK